MSRMTPGIKALVAVGAVALIVAGAIVWAVLDSGSQPTTAGRSTFADLEPAWASAMRKADVEATFPAAPVQVEAVTTTGRQPFEATFTAEEMSALLAVYRFEAEMPATLSSVRVAFPDDGVAEITARIRLQGATYEGVATMPLEYSVKGIDSPGLTALTVDGFKVTGEQRRQASDALLAYLNGYLRAVPGLTVEQARITAGGLVVKGMAPVRIENPVGER